MVNLGSRCCFATITTGKNVLRSSTLDDSLILHRLFHVGVRLCKPRKRYQWRKDRQPANTQLAVDGEEVLETRRTYGGRSKVKAVFKNKGVYTLKSQGIELQVPILDIIHSASHKDHVKNKIMTKGAIVQIDGTEFRNRLANSTFTKPTSEHNQETEPVPNSSSNEEQPESPSTCGEDKALLELVKSGKLYGRITTRPGQVGLCDGYVLEGTELETTLKKFAIDTDTGNL